MNIRIGEVKNNKDIFALGGLLVHTELGDPVWVKYTTPYLAGRHGGFIAIPEIGSQVLICKPDNSEDWFYFGSVANPQIGEALGAGYETILPRNKEEGLPDPQIYKARGVPQRTVYSSAKGNKVVLSDEYAQDYSNLYAKIESSSGKVLILADSPNAGTGAGDYVDAIILRNEVGDRIKISMSQNGTSAARSIEIEANGPINIISKESELKLHVVDGKEINILNESTGSRRIGLNDPTPGNINITSKNSDINITTNSKNGVIRLEAKGSDGHIVLDSKGTVQIHGAKGVDIVSEQDIVVQGERVHLNPNS